MNDAEILHFNLETRYQNSAEPFFPLNSLKHQQQMDNAEILHFKFDSYKIWMQKFCKAIFPLNSLKNQQQIDNAEILHFNFEKYKIWKQKFCRVSFRQIHYKNNITKLVSKWAGGINERLLKTSGFDVLSSRKKLQNLRGGEGATSPPPRSYVRYTPEG